MSGNTPVSERIKSRRENLGYSQVQLAELAGINSTQLYRYESGKANLRLDAAEKIASALGVSTDWLLHGTLPITRGTSIDPPVPTGDGLILNALELPPALASAVKLLSLQNASTVEAELLKLVQQGLDAMHKKAPACTGCASKGEK